jgi:hypothetical protein
VERFYLAEDLEKGAPQEVEGVEVGTIAAGENDAEEDS